MAPLDDVDLKGTAVEHYSIVALIAAGGQGRVYRGRDERMRRDVAIKVIRPGRVSDAAARRRLATEAEALSRLRHPHVAGLYDFLTHDGRDFIVMEFVAGATLRDILAGGPLPPFEVARLGSQIARGLAAAHAAHVVHRDIKPTNLKITSSGELKILDFGVARLLPPDATLDQETPGFSSDIEVVGTVPYMAPEHLKGEEADERADIFSVGVVLYEMATGMPAFPHRSMAALIDAILRDDPTPPSVMNPHVPPALERIITKAMQKAPAARHQSANELAAALDALLPAARLPHALRDAPSASPLEAILASARTAPAPLAIAAP